MINFGVGKCNASTLKAWEKAFMWHYTLGHSSYVIYWLKINVLIFFLWQILIGYGKYCSWGWGYFKRMIHRGCRPCRSYFLQAVNICLDHIVALCRSLCKSSSCLLILVILLVSIPEYESTEVVIYITKLHFTINIVFMNSLLEYQFRTDTKVL